MIEPVFLPLADWIEAVVTIVFLVVAGISAFAQFLAKQRELQRPPRPHNPARPPGGQPAPGGQLPAGGLQDEIGEFLRRAAQQRGQARPAARPVAPPPAPRPSPPVQRRLAEPASAPAARRPVGEGVAEKVAEDLDTSAFRTRASQLGQETRQAAARVQERVHEAFDHELGQLAEEQQRRARKQKARKASAAAVTAESLPPTSAAGFAALLANADNVRQAIVLNEILQRPEHRW